MYYVNLNGERKFRTIDQLDAAITAEENKPPDPQGVKTTISWDEAMELVRYAKRRRVTITRDGARSRIARAKEITRDLLALKGINKPTNKILEKQYNKRVTIVAIKICKTDVDKESQFA